MESADQLAHFQRNLPSVRGGRNDWASRFLLPLIEDFATEQLMETAVKPAWLIWGALALTLGGAGCFSRGWLGAGLVLLLLSMPLDLIAGRIATIRLKPLPVKMLSRLALWPAAGIALLAIGFWEMRHGTGWGSLVSAAAACAFAEAARIEKPSKRAVSWLFAPERDCPRRAVRAWRGVDRISPRSAALRRVILLHCPARAPSSLQLTRI